MKFKDKAVVITGGGTGIGRAMCLRFAREGAAVVVNYSKSKMQADEVVSQIKEAGGRAWSIQADVTSDAEARQLIAQAAEQMGRFRRL